VNPSFAQILRDKCMKCCWNSSWICTSITCSAVLCWGRCEV